MSVAKRFRALARYNVLTPVAVLVVLAATPAMAQTLTIDAPETDGISLSGHPGGPYDALVNNSSITDTPGDTAVGSDDPVVSITNNGDIIGDENSAIGLDTHIGTLTNNGKVEGEGYNAIWIAKGATKFVNAKSGTITNTGATFVNPGDFGGSAVGFNTRISNGGAVGTFINDGTITAASDQDPNELQATVGFFGTNDPTQAYQVGTFSNTGTISGMGTGVSFNGGVNTFANTGTITSTADNAISIRGEAGTFTNAGTLSGFGYNAVNIQNGITSFVNAAGGRIENTTASNHDGGTAVGFQTDTLDGGVVDSFANYGTIVGGTSGDPGQQGPTIGFYEDGNGASQVGTFFNAGSITGPGTGIGFNGGVQSFTNAAGGTISSTDGNGINSDGDIGTFFNAGTITSTDDNAVSINGIVNSFTNSGTLSGGGGVNLDGGAGSVSNSGTITGTMWEALRVAGAGGTTVTNSGTISGDTGIGLDSGGAGNTVINSGKVIGTGGTAIAFDWGAGSDDTLKILTGSQLVGRVEFGGGADTFDFSGFRGTTVVEVRSAETLTAGSTTFVSALDNNGNGAVGIFDQTGAAGVGGAVTGDVVGAIQGAVSGALDGIGTIVSPTEPTAFVEPARLTGAAGAAEEAVLTELDTAQNNGTEVWGQVFGGGSRDDAPVALTHLYGGIVAGSHTQLTSNTRLGGLLGVVGSTYDIGNGTQRIATQLGVLGLYGETDLGAVVIDYSLIGGGAGHTSTRDVLVLGTLETLRANFSSWFVSPSLGITIPLLADDGATVNIAASASYAYGQVSGYTETGTTLSIAVGSVPVGVFDGRLELNGTKLVGATEHGDVTLRGKVGVLVQANVGGSNVPVTFSGGGLSAASSFTNPGSTSFGGYAGAGLSADIAHNVVLDVGGDVLLRTDGLASIGGKVGLTGSF